MNFYVLYTLNHKMEYFRIDEGEYREGIDLRLEVINAQTVSVTAEVSQIEDLADYKIALTLLERTMESNKAGRLRNER